jgi:hypothetical protein
MRCETCGSFEAEHGMPLIGDLCFACYTILGKPFVCEGLIHSESILSIAGYVASCNTAQLSLV